MNHQSDKILLALAAALSLLTCYQAGARTADRSQRAEFRAGRSTETAGVVEFSKGFELVQGSLTITSDSARLFRNPQGELVRIEILGTSQAPAKWREELDDGSSLNARAERIDYHMVDERAVLVGQAQVQKAADVMRAATINYDLKSQHLDAGGDSDQPVLFIYNPPNTEKADPDDKP